MIDCLASGRVASSEDRSSLRSYLWTMPLCSRCRRASYLSGKWCWSGNIFSLLWS